MIQIENTPNPNAIKFLSEHVISEVGTKEFQKNKIKEIKNNFVKTSDDTSGDDEKDSDDEKSSEKSPRASISLI